MFGLAAELRRGSASRGTQATAIAAGRASCARHGLRAAGQLVVRGRRTSRRSPRGAAGRVAGRAHGRRRRARRSRSPRRSTQQVAGAVDAPPASCSAARRRVERLRVDARRCVAGAAGTARRRAGARRGSRDGIRLRRRRVPLPGHRRAPCCATSTCTCPPARRRDRRRERRRQDHAGQAAVPVLRADRGHDHRRRRRPAPTSTRRRGGERIAAGFQDFARFELLAPRDASASATCPASTTDEAVLGALDRARRADVARPAAGRARHPARAQPTRTAPSCPAGSGRSSRSAGR